MTEKCGMCNKEQNETQFSYLATECKTCQTSEVEADKVCGNICLECWNELFNEEKANNENYQRTNNLC